MKMKTKMFLKKALVVYSVFAFTVGPSEAILSDWIGKMLGKIPGVLERRQMTFFSHFRYVCLALI